MLLAIFFSTYQNGSCLNLTLASFVVAMDTYQYTATLHQLTDYFSTTIKLPNSEKKSLLRKVKLGTKLNSFALHHTVSWIFVDPHLVLMHPGKITQYSIIIIKLINNLFLLRSRFLFVRQCWYNIKKTNPITERRSQNYANTNLNDNCVQGSIKPLS